MLVKTYIVALTLGASCLAAPVPTPTSCSGTTARRGYGLICTGPAASKRIEEPVPVAVAEPESDSKTSARGYGLILTSEKDAEGTALSDRGYGLILPSEQSAKVVAPHQDLPGVGTNHLGQESTQPEILTKRTGMGLITSGSDDA
ncbi:hypothetical protein BKA67DRAFT_581593 [Truncatella angustata]|uniref:Uncharacterized protein n=1 Tax=Truncatella angustata TaxID=152316 RepID=A0A9P8RJA3_9PEZI|nr:uncharacterized protein BKA67DRAFT_581593 [Truncatella angustata]KAH6647079.1 hypothetical protein BKA67DRAFT_581593 [Truncatella angustata]KAH8195861.1 hypothetical protein TruAng_009963 [Truncatella angustata]